MRRLPEAKRCDARSPQLDRQRDAIEAPTDRGNRRKVIASRREVEVLRTCPCHKKLHSAVLKDMLRFLLLFGWHVQRRNAINVLAFNPQDFPARRKDRRVGTHVHDRFRHGSRYIDDVFAVVQNQQKLSSADGAGQGLRGNFVTTQLQAENPGDGRWDQSRLQQRDQLNEPDVAAKGLRQATGNLKCQPVLPIPPGPVSVTTRYADRSSCRCLTGVFGRSARTPPVAIGYEWWVG